MRTFKTSCFSCCFALAAALPLMLASAALAGSSANSQVYPTTSKPQNLPRPTQQAEAFIDIRSIVFDRKVSGLSKFPPIDPLLFRPREILVPIPSPVFHFDLVPVEPNSETRLGPDEEVELGLVLLGKVTGFHGRTISNL